MADSFNPETVWEPFGAFSQTVIGGTGQVAYLKGQVSLDQTGTIVGAGDMRMQVQQVLTNIQTVLAAMNGRMSDIVSLSQFTTDIQAFMQSGDIRQQFFTAPFPVTTTLEIASLYDPALVIEITAIAEIPVERFKKPAAALPMHQ